jgi:hypothetical protein
MRQAIFCFLLSLASASGTGGASEFRPTDQDALTESQEWILSYLLCWFLLVGVALISVTFVISSRTQESECLELKESLLPSHFYPRKGDCYYSAPKRGNYEVPLNNL